MIYDRTQSDVDAANKIRENKIKTLQTLTSSDIETLERGFLTYTTLNRIEDKQAQLKQLFSEIGYYCEPIKTTAWALGDAFNATDFQRIIDNENALRNAFIIYSDTPNTPTVSFYYEDINSLEKIIFDLERMVSDVKANYRQCGAYNCGE